MVVISIVIEIINQLITGGAPPCKSPQSSELSIPFITIFTCRFQLFDDSYPMIFYFFPVCETHKSLQDPYLGPRP